MQISVDPATGNLLGQTAESRFTFEEIAAMHLACPHCDTAVDVRPMDAQSPGPDTDPRRFYVGRHYFNCACFSGAVVV